ncbi:MAG: hypothetical protein O7C75_21140 [Verrucomicrobia bacterium]|nr:hypothetical protein [Verrucomicrobiota bacterium]
MKHCSFIGVELLGCDLYADNTISIFSEMVTVNPLDMVLLEPFNFLKIDVICTEFDGLQVASKQLKDRGIIVFDNSDVKSHQAAQEHLKKEGFYRIDFWGLIPSYLYKNCTSIYFKDPCILKPGTLPHEHNSSVGLSCSQALEQGK